MKFLCDRCKTRYSIGDERVRGKILKIRCKNCANVITVREGMDADVPADDAPANGRAGRPTTMSPPAAHAVPASKPPPALDEEWYVSIEGEQSGPFSLTDAQKWIGAKPFDAELHCWSEGFDDWLPVDKVSHFRGVRKKPAAAPPRTPPRAPTRPVPIIEDEPKPLFAATMASLEHGADANHAKSQRIGIAPAMPAAARDVRPAARATPAGGVPVSRTNGASVPAAAKGTGTGNAAIPGPVADRGSANKGRGNTPAKGVRARSGADGDLDRLRTEPDRAPSAGVPGFDVSSEPDPNDSVTAVGAPFQGDSPFAKSAPASMGPPATSSSPPGSGPARSASPLPSPSSPSSRTRSPSAAPPSPFAAAPSPFAAPPSPFAAPPSPFAASPFAAPPSPFAAPAAAPPPLFPPPGQAPDAPGTDDEDDGLEIGEVSRVVNLADLMRSPPPAKDRAATNATRRATGANGALRTGQTPKLDPNGLPGGVLSPAGLPLARPGDAPLLSPDAMADAAQPGLLPPPPPVHQRRTLVALLVVAVLVLGGVGAVVAIALTGSDEDGVELGLGPTDQIDTTRPDDQVRHNPFVPATPGSNVGSAVASPHNPNIGPNVHRPNPPTNPTGSGSSGKVESDPLGPTSPLKAEEVEDMSGKQSTGATRCWERALRKQPYLQKDIKKVSVTITVDALGGVSNVQIAGMPSDDGNLGNCLQSFIRGWRFRQSSTGITAKFSMVFQN